MIRIIFENKKLLNEVNMEKVKERFTQNDFLNAFNKGKNTYTYGSGRLDKGATDNLKKICPTVRTPDIYVPALNKAFQDHDMTTVDRQAMFLAQCLHESMGFKFTREIWGPTTWQLKYEGHVGLGNIHEGDGKLFMGRGLIQLTGRANYQAFANWIGDQSIMSNPQIVEGTNYAVLSAIFFWTKNKLNVFADANDIVGCTRRVNGINMLGLEERTDLYHKAQDVLSID